MVLFFLALLLGLALFLYAVLNKKTIKSAKNPIMTTILIQIPLELSLALDDCTVLAETVVVYPKFSRR